MDASTFTAYRLQLQRSAELDRDHALRVSHRERRRSQGAGEPGRGIRSVFLRWMGTERSRLALAGPSS
ncbi:hypothetical protein ACFUTX_02145 [Microbacterium sp. NPDC057407]|uniref:hypothetical protein n=1 Tax=Microbacterium sp. NPDC057407 TaxID=3346120 RepID=UPI00366D4165